MTKEFARHLVIPEAIASMIQPSHFDGAKGELPSSDSKKGKQQ